MYTLRNYLRPIAVVPSGAPSNEVLALIARMRAFALADAELARLIEEVESEVTTGQRFPADLPA